MRIRSFAIAACVASALVGITALPSLTSAHQGQDQDNTKKKTQKVAIQFKAVAGSTPVTCGKPIDGLGTTSRTAQLTDFRFYVSQVQLLRKGGGKVNLKLGADSQWHYKKGNTAVTLIDLENGTGDCAEDGTKGINAYVRGTVPRGKYVGVRWQLGVPYALNHTDLTTAPAPLNLTAMAWSWQAGRKFAKIEVSEGGGPAWQSKTFYVHLGSAGCSGDPAAGETVGCTFPNRAEIPLKKFNPTRQLVAVDLKTLLAGVDVAVNGSGAPGCMSAPTDPECPTIFRSLGMKLGTTDRTRQSAFRVVKK
jgi:uncharacterized repeat protein (TIGR04052 family)